MILLRTFIALLFILYAASVPIFAENFYNNNPNTSLYLILSCFVISFLLYSGKALLLNIIIAFYVFKQYLTRPYVDIFHDQLNASQLNYILANDSYYTSAGAEVVYLSLLSLLIAWTLGLFSIKPKKSFKPFYPWIFKEIDKIISTPDWRLIFVFFLLTYLNYIDVESLFRSIRGIESTPLFAYGLFASNIVIFICLAHFLYSRIVGAKKVYLILLIPIIYSMFTSMVNGGRGAFYNIFIFIILYWFFLNCNKSITYIDIKRFFILIFTIPILLFTGLIAQSLKVYHSKNARNAMAEIQTNYELIISNINIFNSENPIVQSFYFGLTELFHRVSHLQAQFLILNDRYINLPSETYNVPHIIMRIVNDLLPGAFFKDVIDINHLFNYIYFDSVGNYASHTWGIQGTMYILFGFLGSAIFIFFIALLISRYYYYIFHLVKVSPAFFTFITFILLTLLENGTIEQVFIVYVIRPIATILFFIIMIKALSVFSLQNILKSVRKE